MKATLANLLAYVGRIHWKRVLSVSAGTFATGAGLYLSSHIDPSANLTFGKLGGMLEGAAAYGLVPTIPVLGGMLINSVRDKKNPVIDDDGDVGEDPMDESRDIDPAVALPAVPIAPVAVKPTRAKKAGK